MSTATPPSLAEAALLLGDVAVEIDDQALCCGNERLHLIDVDEWQGELYRCECGAEFEGSEIDRRMKDRRVAAMPATTQNALAFALLIGDEEVPF
jgi:hypothetical protein